MTYTKTGAGNGVNGPSSSNNNNNGGGGSSIPASLASSSSAGGNNSRLVVTASGEFAGNLGSGAASGIEGNLGIGNSSDSLEYGKETIVGGFLGVKVVKGSKMVRKKDDLKMHHSYEVS